jgi:hypothetical protein
MKKMLRYPSHLNARKYEKLRRNRLLTGTSRSGLGKSRLRRYVNLILVVARNYRFRNHTLHPAVADLVDVVPVALVGKTHRLKKALSKAHSMLVLAG